MSTSTQKIIFALASFSSLILSHIYSSDAAYNVNQKVNRRKAIQNSIMATAVGGIIFDATSSEAAENAGEAVRQGMANIPGYGPSDIIYPDSFDGKWKLKRATYLNGEKEPSEIIEYEVRFLRKEKGIVADRGFNEASRILASGGHLVRQTNWDVTNPNTLSLTFQDGGSREIRVTKRSSDLKVDAENWLLESSEFARVSEVGGRGIPDLSIVHTLAKWKPNVSEDNVIADGIELIFNESNLGDPMSFATGPGGADQKTKKKCRLRLERL